MIKGEFIALLSWGKHATPFWSNGPFRVWNYRQGWSLRVCTCWFTRSWTCPFSVSPSGQTPWQFFNTSPTRRDNSNPLLPTELMRLRMVLLLSEGDMSRHLCIRLMRALERWKDVLSIRPVAGCLYLSSFCNPKISGQFSKSVIFLTATKKFELKVMLRSCTPNT